MAEEKKEKSPEEKLREDRLNNLKSLSMYQGASLLHSGEYGSKGTNAYNVGYDSFLAGGKANEIRNNVYGKKAEEGNQKGIIARPEVSNYEVESSALELISDAQQNLSLGDLEKIVKETSPGLLTEGVENKFKDNNFAEVYEKMQKANQKTQMEALKYVQDAKGKGVSDEEIQEKLKEFDEKAYKPSKEEQAVIEYHKGLSEAYQQASAMNLMMATAGREINENFKGLAEKFKPKEESKDPKKSE